MAWFMAAAPYIAMGVGTIMSAEQQKLAGKQEEQNALFEAAQMERNAKNVEAESQREAIRAKREARYIASRAKAVAAASGGGADDPTVVDLMSGIEAEGELNALNALYSGTTKAKTYRGQAAQTRISGRQARQAGKTGAIGTLLKGVSGMASYG